MAAIFQIRRGTSDISSSITDGELYLHKGKGSLQFSSGSGNPITLLPLNVPVIGDINLSGSISASGDIRIGGNIYLGDNLANDSVNVNSPFSGSLIPSGSNIFDLGSNAYKYKNVYATSISGAIAATNGVISGSSQILGGTGIVSGSSQITYANISSIPSGIFSGSSQVDADSITNFDSNVKDRLNTDGVISGSSQITPLLPNGVVSGSSQISLGSVTGNSTTNVTEGTNLYYTDARVKTKLNAETVVSGSSQITLSSVTGYGTVINQNLLTTSDVTHNNLTLAGNLIVNGTTTTINSTTVQIGDNIIELNGTGIANGGLLVKDPTGGSTLSGSLLWDSTNDYWKGGTLSNESKLLRADGDSVVSGSSQITSLLPIGVVSGSSQIANLGYATTGSNSFVGNQSINGNLYLTGSLIPSGNFVYDLGSSTNGFGDVYLSSSTVYMNNNPIFGTTDVVPVFVGDYLQGGIVYYVDTVNGFSYIVNKDDIGQVDSSNFTRVGSANSSVIGGGIANTNAITASTGGQQNPAKLCSDFSGGGYTDWYLPSTRELALIASNTNLMAASLAGVRYVRYWSSTADANASKTYYAGDDNTDDQHYTGYGYGNGIMYSVPDNNTSFGYVKAVRRTNITEIIRTLSFPNFNFSGSINVEGTIDGVAIGAYVTQSNERITNLESSSINLNIVSSSLNSYTASASGRLNNIELTTASLNTLVSSLNTYTGSVDGRFTSLATISGSLILSASAVSSSVWNLHQFSASINFFSSSTFTEFSNSYDAVSESFDYRLSILDPGNIGDALLGINTFTSSTNNRLNNLEATTSSLNSFSSSINTTIKTKLDTDGVISGSSQVSYIGLSNIPSGIISSSAQIDTLFNIDGIVSGSSQVISLLPTGTISGSAQISGSIFNTITGDVLITSNGLATIQANSVALGVDTTGNYMSDLTQGTGVTISHTPGEGSTATISIAQAVATTSDVQFGSLGIGGAASGVSGEIRAWGDITAFYSSDIRLKENVTPIENALSKVESITGNTYNWKEGFEEIHSHKGNDLGVIAQEVQSVLPDVVKERDNGYLAVDYIKLVPVLIEAIKELSAKIKELENK